MFTSRLIRFTEGLWAKGLNAGDHSGTLCFVGENFLDSVAGDGRQGYLVTRGQALSSGDSDTSIRRRLAEGRWVVRQAGVYQVDLRQQSWLERLWAAVLAGGPGSLVSHRAAMVVWALDGLAWAPVEVTVPYSNLPVPKDAFVHRTRRVQDQDVCDGLPLTSVPRTLLDCAGLLPEVILVKAVDSAVRKGLTSPATLQRFVEERGGRGVRGTRRLRGVVSAYASDTAPGSPAESEAYALILESSLPRPVLQREFQTPTGVKRPDFFWPEFQKAVEVDGLDAHSSAEALESDLRRQNELLDLGIELRRYTARQVRRDPTGFTDDLRRYLSD